MFRIAATSGLCLPIATGAAWAEDNHDRGTILAPNDFKPVFELRLTH